MESFSTTLEKIWMRFKKGYQNLFQQRRRWGLALVWAQALSLAFASGNSHSVPQIIFWLLTNGKYFDD